MRTSLIVGPRKISHIILNDRDGTNTTNDLRISHNFAAAVVMAIEQYTQRQTFVVPEIEFLGDCAAVFAPPIFVDMADATLTIPRISREKSLCAILTPLGAKSVSEMVPLAEALNIPLVTFRAEQHNPMRVISTTTSIKRRAEAMVTYPLLRERRLLSVFHTEHDDPLVDELKIRTEMEVLSFFAHDITTAESELKRMRDTGIRTVYLHLKNPGQLVEYAGLLEQLDMLKGDFLYIVSPQAAPTDSLSDVFVDELGNGSPIDLLLSNALIFDVLDRFRSSPASDSFLRYWERQGPATVSRVNTLLPDRMDRMPPDFFELNKQPANYVSFAFDSVLVLAITLCSFEAEIKRLEESGELPELQLPIDFDIPSVPGLIVSTIALQPSQSPTTISTIGPTSQDPQQQVFVTVEPSSAFGTDPASFSTFTPTATAQRSTERSIVPSSISKEMVESSNRPISSNFDSAGPVRTPSTEPRSRPTSAPRDDTGSFQMLAPSGSPSLVPSELPIIDPSSSPTVTPSHQPTSSPTGTPPIDKPSSFPTAAPSDSPSVIPTTLPTERPSASPSSNPSSKPTVNPSQFPSSSPTRGPSYEPSSHPSDEASSFPTSAPSDTPSASPSAFQYFESFSVERNDGSVIPYVGQVLDCPFHEEGNHMLIYAKRPDVDEMRVVRECDASEQKNKGDPFQLDIKLTPSNGCIYRYEALDTDDNILAIVSLDVTMLYKNCDRRALLSRSPRSYELFYDLFISLVVKSRFIGASNFFAFDENSRQRDSIPIHFGVYQVFDSSAQSHSKTALLISILTSEGGWQDVLGTQMRVKLPTPYALEHNDNVLPLRLRLVGLWLMIIAGIVAIVSMALLLWQRSHPRVREDHLFLQFMCVGSACISLSIVFLSFDEGSSISVSAIEIFCSCSSWTFFLSQNMVALTLLFRANKNRSETRHGSLSRRLSLAAYCLPVGVVATLFIWSLIDPMNWKRVYVSNYPPETVGFCWSEYTSVFLCIAIGLTVSLYGIVLFNSWKNASSETTRSGSMSVCCTVLQAYCIGIPMLLILKDDPSPVGAYFVEVILIWIVAISILALMVWPVLADAIPSKSQSRAQRFHFKRGLSDHKSEVSQLEDVTS